MRRPSGWFDAEGVVTDEDEGTAYHVAIRYCINPGSDGDLITPNEPPFVDGIRLVSVREVGSPTESKDATIWRRTVKTDLWRQVESLAERAFEDEST